MTRAIARLAAIPSTTEKAPTDRCQCQRNDYAYDPFLFDCNVSMPAPQAKNEPCLKACKQNNFQIIGIDYSSSEAAYHLLQPLSTGVIKRTLTCTAFFVPLRSPPPPPPPPPMLPLPIPIIPMLLKLLSILLLFDLKSLLCVLFFCVLLFVLAFAEQTSSRAMIFCERATGNKCQMCHK